MIAVNNREYTERPEPVVGICLDGCAEEYLDAASDVMPNLLAIREKGSFGRVSTGIPSFTNPNNMAIVTGVPPAMNGICGNYYYDRETGEEVTTAVSRTVPPQCGQPEGKGASSVWSTSSGTARRAIRP